MGFVAALAALAALAGPGDDRRLIRITAPVRPGNGDGPVLDSAGNAVGVVVAKLDASPWRRRPATSRRTSTSP